MPPLRLAPGVLRWEEAGSVFRGGKGTGSRYSVIWTRPPGAGWLTRTTCPLARVPPPPSWFQVKITLGLGLVFCLFLKIKMERKGIHQGQEWLACARFMELSKSEESRNLGYKHRQELPLEISAWPHDYQALQHLSAPPLLERWQSKNLNTPGTAFHLSNMSPWPSTLHGWPELQAEAKQRETTDPLNRDSRDLFHLVLPQGIHF